MLEKRRMDGDELALSCSVPNVIHVNCINVLWLMLQPEPSRIRTPCARAGTQVPRPVNCVNFYGPTVDVHTGLKTAIPGRCLR